MCFAQGREICGPEGRDCIERNSAKSFNCSTTCEGMYADVQWVGTEIEEDEGAGYLVKTAFNGEVDEELRKLRKRLSDLERKMDLVEGAIGEKGEELDKEKYKVLIAEYRKFKKTNVKHFRINSAEHSSEFGEFHFGSS